ncbi:hypothetical protein DFO73_101362 [Cytobacillus oceanisediminis]|jgi:hypothetical protein|uniref:Uncharacterized protein n=1 Tax=Cytobacillus oceanisediminis TaxID=665099 RepID=A0A2V3A5E6_9BACI|nr:CBO0543 family protein [Cytobacillus oceanisediminis]PWW32099.1 hypothetical protein DFO73_101362 [Cytobacillus oceanisediminis]
MSFEEGIQQSEKAYQKFVEVSSMFSDTVNHAFIFTWQWWLGVTLFIIPWVLWFTLRKKESTGRLLLGGFITIILSITIDLVALSLGLWSYPMVITTISPLLFLPYHFSLAPVAIMFTLQIKPGTNPLIKGIVFSAIAAFVGMNIFDLIDFYNPKGWSTFYDFFIFLTLYYVAYMVSNLNSFESLK